MIIGTQCLYGSLNDIPYESKSTFFQKSKNHYLVTLFPNVTNSKNLVNLSQRRIIYCSFISARSYTCRVRAILLHIRL